MNEDSEGQRRTRPAGAGARWRAALAVAAALSASACTTAIDRGDRSFAASDYRAASEAYESALAAAGSNGTYGRGCGDRLFRLALTYSLPSSEVQEPERAEELLEALAEQCPESPWGEVARMLISDRTERRRLLAGITVERARADALEAHLDRLAGVRAAVEDARAAEARSEAEHNQEVTRLRRQIAELRAQIDARDRRVAELENELRRLKDIDLQ